jgi:hypothetical protein
MVLIPQHEVARVAALLARDVGCAVQPPAQPAALALACEHSQRGWEELDDFPAPDAAGLPSEADDLPRTEQIAAWRRTTDAAWELAQQDEASLRAAALLSIAAMQWSTRPALHRGETRRETFDFNCLLHREAERLEPLKEQLGLRQELPTRHGLPEALEEHGQLSRTERELVREVRLLELLLELASEICAHTVVERAVGVVSSAWDAPERLVRARWSPGSNGLQVAPWLFMARRHQLEIRAAAIAPRRYRDSGELRQALRQGNEVMTTVILTPSH